MAIRRRDGMTPMSEFERLRREYLTRSGQRATGTVPQGWIWWRSKVFGIDVPLNMN